MDLKLFDSERRVMECLWSSDGSLTAKEIAGQLSGQVGWSKTTTYTVIRKCIDKGIIKRIDPGFHCYPLVTREEVCTKETEELIERNFGGSADLLVASLLGAKRLSKEEIERMKELIKELR